MFNWSFILLHTISIFTEGSEYHIIFQVLQVYFYSPYNKDYVNVTCERRLKMMRKIQLHWKYDVLVRHFMLH